MNRRTIAKDDVVFAWKTKTKNNTIKRNGKRKK